MIKRTNSKKSILAKLNLSANSYLLGENNDSKTIKGTKYGVLTGIMYLIPNDVICPVSTIAGCRNDCLVKQGRAAMFQKIQIARNKRTLAFHNQRDLFMELLIEHEIPRIIKKANKLNMEPCIRLNGTSDINWSKVYFKGKTVFEWWPDIQFYDYTKSPSIIRASSSINNWHITASYSEANKKYTDLITAAANKYGVNLAVVFRKDKPDFFLNRKVIDGDESDIRFKDEKGVIVALKAKGTAKKDKSGFVIDALNLINKV